METVEEQRKRYIHCPGCGESVLVLPWKKRVLLEIDPVWVRTDTHVENTYVLPNGGTIFGEKVGDAFEDSDVALVMAYESHLALCPNRGRRKRKPRDREPVGLFSI